MLRPYVLVFLLERPLRNRMIGMDELNVENDRHF
jgi:hypothetical protein